MSYQLIFSSTRESEEQTQLESFVNTRGELVIKIEGDGIQYICLDRESAVKLGREIRKQISIIDRFMEVENGNI
jgi:hypothetical protein